jgi:hypothetical protein
MRPGYYPAVDVRVSGVYYVRMHIENVNSHVFYIPFEVLRVVSEAEDLYEVKPMTESSCFSVSKSILYDKR